jgi:MFS family permease
MSLKQDKVFSATSVSIYGVTILFYTIIYMVLMVLPIYTHNQKANYITIGWIMGITMLTSMVCRPIAGRLVDRYGTSRIFFISIVLFAFSLCGYFFNSTIMYWLVRLIQGAVAACFSTAMEIITINLLSDRLRGQGLSLYSLATVIPTVFAPVLSLYLIQHTSVQFIFLLLFIFGICNVAISWLLFKKVVELDIKSSNLKSQSIKDFLTNQRLLIPTIIMAIASVANGAVFTFLPLYLSSISSPFVETYFLLQMLTLVCARFFGSKFLKLNTVVPISLVFLLLMSVCCGFVIIAFFPTPAGLSIAAIANGIAFALLYPALLTITSFRINSAYKGYFLGIFIGGADFGFAMGAILIGFIAQMVSLHIAFTFCAILTFVTLPLCLNSSLSKSDTQD